MVIQLPVKLVQQLNEFLHNWFHHCITFCIYLGGWTHSGMSVCLSRPGCLSGAFYPLHLPIPPSPRRWAVQSSLELILVDESTGKRQLLRLGVVEVFSGIPQGSVLGLLLFLLFVNDLPQWILNKIWMFATDAKLWCIMQQPEDSASLQDDLDSNVKWSARWR